MEDGRQPTSKLLLWTGKGIDIFLFLGILLLQQDYAKSGTV